jgi:hypothetical protein
MEGVPAVECCAGAYHIIIIVNTTMLYEGDRVDEKHEKI